ncbi:hypothetical protein TB2_009067 [Malus domestica]
MAADYFLHIIIPRRKCKKAGKGNWRTNGVEVENLSLARGFMRVRVMNRVAGYGEWMKTAAVRDIQKNSRPLVSFQGERRLAGTTREEARRGEHGRQVDGTRKQESDSRGKHNGGHVREQNNQLSVKTRNVFPREFHETNRNGGQGHKAVQWIGGGSSEKDSARIYGEWAWGRTKKCKFMGCNNI